MLYHIIEQDENKQTAKEPKREAVRDTALFDLFTWHGTDGTDSSDIYGGANSRT